MYSRDPVTKTVDVKILTSITPEFVSLVDHGAIQTPLKIVKADILETTDNGDTDMSKQVRDRTITESSVSKSAVNTSVEVAKVNFSAENFTNEPIVTKWLVDGGYKDYKVSKTDTGYVAEWDIPEGYDTTALKSLKQVAGVEVVLVPAVKAVEKDKEITPANLEQIALKTDEKVTKADKLAVFETSKAELTKKFDYWNAYFTEGATSIAEVFRAGADSLPVGIYELNNAFSLALSNATETGNLSLIDSITQEFADYYKKLIAAVPEAIAMETTMTLEKTEKSDTPITDVLGDNAKTLTSSNVDVNAITDAITSGFASIMNMFSQQAAKADAVDTTTSEKDVVVAKADELVVEEKDNELVKTVKALQDRIDVLENSGQLSNNLGNDETTLVTAKKEVDPLIERAKKRGVADLFGL